MVESVELPVQPIQWLGLPRDYLQPGEMEALVALVRSIKAESMVEFGCRNGRTARVLLHNVATLNRYIGVDVPWGYRPGLPQQRAEMVMRPGWLMRKDPRFELVLPDRGTLDLEPQDFQPVDAVFIDGDHSQRVVAHDSRLAQAIVRPGGLVVWHDYLNQDVNDVTLVIDELIGNGWPIRVVTGTWLAFMHKARENLDD